MAKFVQLINKTIFYCRSSIYYKFTGDSLKFMDIYIHARERNSFKYISIGLWVKSGHKTNTAYLQTSQKKKKNIYIKDILTGRSESRTQIPKFEELDLSS